MTAIWYKARHLIENFFARLKSGTAPLPRVLKRAQLPQVPSIWPAAVVWLGGDTTMDASGLPSSLS
jgi:hypothetical protein